MLEDARRTAQAEIPQILQSQIDLETTRLTQELEASRKENEDIGRNLKQEQEKLASLTMQLNDALRLRQSAEKQLEICMSEAKDVSAKYREQLAALQTTKSPDWYQEQTRKWLAERTGYQEEIKNLNGQVGSLTDTVHTFQIQLENTQKQLDLKKNELETLRQSTQMNFNPGDALDIEYLDVPEDEQLGQSDTPQYGEGQMIAFMGTGRGVGNTTIALNTAISLANCGFKICFIELNRQFHL